MSSRNDASQPGLHIARAPHLQKIFVLGVTVVRALPTTTVLQLTSLPYYPYVFLRYATLPSTNSQSPDVPLRFGVPSLP